MYLYLCFFFWCVTSLIWAWEEEEEEDVGKKKNDGTYSTKNWTRVHVSILHSLSLSLSCVCMWDREHYNSIKMPFVIGFFLFLLFSIFLFVVSFFCIRSSCMCVGGYVYNFISSTRRFPNFLPEYISAYFRKPNFIRSRGKSDQSRRGK